MKPLTIGKVARRAGVGVETLRFYEREGLIDEPPRTESGYRQYPEETVPRVRFIRRAKELGFTLKEIKELLSLRVGPRSSCGAVRKRSEAKVRDIQEKIRTLRRMEKALMKLVDACKQRSSTGECPILDALDSEVKP